MDAEPKYSIFFSTGAWHTPAMVEPFRQFLTDRGHPTYTVMMPTNDVSPILMQDLTPDHQDYSTPPKDPMPDMWADAAAVQSKLREIVDAGENVLLFCHSYGATPGAQALTPDLTLTHRRAAGLPGGVFGWITHASWMPPPGISNWEFGKGVMPPEFPLSPSGLVSMQNPAHTLFHDVPDAQRDVLIAQLRTQAVQAHMNPLSNAGYLHVPAAYVVTTDDRVVPADPVQRLVIQSMRDAGARLTVDEIHTGHQPFLTVPERVSELVEGFARKAWAEVNLEN